MDKDFYLSYLDELTDRERSIFFYRFIFKLPPSESAKRLKITVKEIAETSSILEEQKELMLIKYHLLEAYEIGDML